MLVYIGVPAKSYTARGEPQKSVTLSDFFGGDAEFPDVTDSLERLWLLAPWFLVPSSQGPSSRGLRRDVCVAGHYLRIVLREDRKNRCFSLWVAPMDRREGRITPHSWAALQRGPFISFLHRETPDAAALAFFRLFQPGPPT